MKTNLSDSIHSILHVFHEIEISYHLPSWWGEQGMVSRRQAINYYEQCCLDTVPCSNQRMKKKANLRGNGKGSSQFQTTFF